MQRSQLAGGRALGGSGCSSFRTKVSSFSRACLVVSLSAWRAADFADGGLDLLVGVAQQLLGLLLGGAQGFVAGVGRGAA
ncbi:MAG: hypothetical protein WKG07_43110 [Hymenobacter sp.]